LQRALEHGQLLHLGEGDVAMPARREELQKLIERRRGGGLSGRGAGSRECQRARNADSAALPPHTSARGAAGRGIGAVPEVVEVNQL